MYPAGCSTMARTKRTAPVTWEALASPRHIPVSRRAGDPSPTHDTLAGARVVGPLRQRTSARIEVGHRQGEPEPWPMGAGSRRAAYERWTSGNGVAPGPGRAKAARVDVNFRREPCPVP